MKTDKPYWFPETFAPADGGPNETRMVYGIPGEPLRGRVIYGGSRFPKSNSSKWIFLALLIACLTLFGVHARLSHRTAVERDRLIEELTDALEESTLELEKRPPAQPQKKPVPGAHFRPGDIII
jgi:hypothetical protein